MNSASEKPLLLIDANSLIHRVFHALPPLTTKEGKPVQALYGLSSILLRLWREEKPVYAAALFDRPEPTFRKERYPEYKAQRPKAPDALIAQIIDAHELFRAFGIRAFECRGFEADDLIATLTERFRCVSRIIITILTGDTDTFQLVQDPEVRVRLLRRGISDTVLFDVRAIHERFGLSPAELVDYKALTGDSSDNVPGVPGIGPKTAKELLLRFGTIEGALAHANESGKAGEKLLAAKEHIALLRDLIALKRDVDLGDIALEDLRVPDSQKQIAEYFRSLGFSTLLARFEGHVSNRTNQSSQGKMF